MDSFAQWFWLLIWWFLFFAYLVILFQIIGDLFRDHALSGWWKAVWIIFLIVVPFLTALDLHHRARQGHGGAAAQGRPAGQVGHGHLHP